MHNFFDEFDKIAAHGFNAVHGIGQCTTWGFYVDVTPLSTGFNAVHGIGQCTTFLGATALRDMIAVSMPFTALDSAQLLQSIFYLAVLSA